jgi:hypothetical protein
MITLPVKKLLPFVLAVMFSQQSLAITLLDQLKVYGDVRLRLESDFDSQKSNGTDRDDRDRLRTRVRLGFTFKPREDIELGMRLRSGSDDSHQSPHITLVDFDNNDTGDSDFNLDKWYFKYSSGKSTFTAGRNSTSFWRQNEIFFEDDVTPIGVSYILQGEQLGLNVGYYTLPVGMQEFSGNLGTLQISFKGNVGSGSFVGGIGYAQFDAEPGDKDSETLLDGNGARDYGILTASGQLKIGVMKFGVDYFVNNEDYSENDPDAFTAFHRDEDTGYVFSAAHGGTSPKKWLFAYYYLHIETLAVNSSYAQDDWVRFGSAVETRATNIEGHELRVGYGLAKNMNLIFRAYFVDAIQERFATSIAKEDGTRLRLDFNYKF